MGGQQFVVKRPVLGVGRRGHQQHAGQQQRSAGKTAAERLVYDVDVHGAVSANGNHVSQYLAKGLMDHPHVTQ
jgi:hypothetical protein